MSNQLAFNDTTNLDGIIQICERLVFSGDYGRISGNTTLLKEFTSLVNQSQMWVYNTILPVEQRTEHGLSTSDLTMSDGVQEVDMSSLQLQRVISVEVKDIDGNYYQLEPINVSQIVQAGETPSEFYDTAGKPVYYDVYRDTSASGSHKIKLYPAPDTAKITLSSGLRVIGQKALTVFTTSSTTDYPAVPEGFQYLIPLKASLMYAESKQMRGLASSLGEQVKDNVSKMEENLKSADYRNRPRLSSRFRSFV